ncbi:TetR/AcrR family transcriptional regulator [Streptomyces sp. NPDC026659]|uniref:TetR/AcrR family transcriptional regulator n=1 Tax=Streptomyces sp. NPDC026659 TaxID=3155123 RepID=UPI0033F77AB0
MQRRRGPQLENALLDAAWAELAERGYAGFTVESVAQRAGTSTPVLYRRWANKHELVTAAVTHAATTRTTEAPDTGSLRGDLIAMMRRANETRVDLLAALTAVLGTYFEETGTSPAELRRRVLGNDRSTAETILQRAVDRGEVPAEKVTARITALPFDLFRHEVLTTLQPVPDDVIEEIVDDIVLPLTSGPARRA